MILSSLLGLALAAVSHAACTSPAGVAGQFQYISADYKYCDGSTWKSMAAAAPAAACSGAGAISVSGTDVRFCNGTSFVSMNGSETNGTCAAGSTGTIRYSAANSWMEWCNGTNWKVMRASGGPAPTIASLSLVGTIGTGGGSTTVTGTNFVNGAVVKINGTNCTSTTFVSATQLTCAIPSSGAATTIAKVDVTVTNPDSQVGTLVGGFTYLGAPRLWMKADAGITITSGKVSAWADSSGSGVSGAGWAAANNPTLINSPNFNNKPVVYFNGNHIIDIGDAAGVPRNVPGLTTVAAARITGTAASWIWAFQNAGNNGTRTGLGIGPPQEGTNVGTSATGDVYFTGRRLQANALTYLRGGSPANNPFVVSASVNFVSRAGSLKFNGTEVSTTSTFSTGGGNTNDADSVNSGIGSNDGYDWFTGEIAEFLIYGTTLSAAETTIVENYVKGRYNLP